jgi:hypothetical protein
MIISGSIMAGHIMTAIGTGSDNTGTKACNYYKSDQEEF